MPTVCCSLSFTAVDAVDTFSATLAAVCDVISETDSEDLLLDSVSDAVFNLADAEAVFVSIFVGEPGSDCDVAVETVVVVVLEPRPIVTVDTFSATLAAVCDVISETDFEDLLLDSVSDAVFNLADAEAVFVSIFVGEPGNDRDVAVETVVVVVLEPRSVNRACHMLTCKYAIRSFDYTRLQSIST